MTRSANRRFHIGTAVVPGGPMELHEDLRRHLQVLRVKTGDDVVLFDGVGGCWTATLQELTRHRAVVRIGAAVEDAGVESPLRVTVAQGLARGNRMAEVVRHGCELGVVAFAPVVCERSTRRDGKVARWRAIAEDAARQCGRSVVPAVDEIRPLGEYLGCGHRGLCLVLSTGEAPPLSRVLPAELTDVAILVGPEGGLEAREEQRAVEAGFQPVSLGPRVLRTETAAVAAVSALQFARGDWR